MTGQLQTKLLTSDLGDARRQREINASSYTADSRGKLSLCILPHGSYLICHVGTLSSAHFGVVDIKL